MISKRIVFFTTFLLCSFFITSTVSADLTLTSGSNTVTTPNVATSITGFQIVGPSDTVTPVKLRATNGTLTLSSVSGVTMSGNGTGTVNLNGTVATLNTALSTLKYTRATTGTDTLEVSLVDPNQIFFPDNNHVYQYVSGSINWNNAKIAAEGRTAYGASGYLATVTSVSENNFIKARLSGDAWIGGSDSQTEGTWKWVGGPESGTTFWQGVGNGSPVGGNYANWNPGEPNQSGEEDCAETYIADGTWNDLPCTATVSGYVVEFGTPGNTPTVVATTISITTADVPAITTLSPANGTTLVSPDANLVISFTKTVTPDTGVITIHNSSDDSIVESIDVTSGAITGGGTNGITINPVETLAEGTQYYVLIPTTAFKDASDNPFSGISADTIWVFTTDDVTAPVLTNVTATPTEHSAVITWNTNELASTKLTYSNNGSFGTATTETDISTRVTSHSVTLTGLVACTSYEYKANSRDSFLNSGFSEESTFMTTGCIGGGEPTTVRVAPVDPTVPSTSTLEESGREFSVKTPADFTNESSVVIQIKSSHCRQRLLFLLSENQQKNFSVRQW